MDFWCFQVVLGRSAAVPGSLIFLRETLVSGPGPLLFRCRTAYFRWKLGENVVFLGGS